MKKNDEKGGKNCFSCSFLKLLVTMKLILILICGVGLLGSMAEGFAQSTKLTFSIKDETVKNVLLQIESNSDFSFMYDNNEIDVNRKVNIKVENQSIEQILGQIFKNENINYRTVGNHIILYQENQLSVNENSGQQKHISGKVIDSNGEPLPGVAVVVKGTMQGTVTDINGDYNIPDLPENTVLQFSFVGMKSQEVAVTNQTSINITMIEESIGLEEVVAIGYGTQKKASLTGAISQVGEEDLSQVSSSNLVQRIQGKVSGVTIINSHTPGGDATVRVRGMGTINNNNPLYVIDGVPTKEGLSQLNPNDIESMTVLKDASSAAIYGARGANGVIIITTKKGNKEPKISFNARVGMQKAQKYYDLLNTQEYGELLWLEAANDGTTPGNDLYGYGSEPVIPYYALAGSGIASQGAAAADLSNYSYTPGNYYLIVKANQQGTDWYDEILQVAPVEEYNLSISGGSEKGTYAFSGGYFTQDGILIHTGYDRYSLRSNANAKFNDWLEVGETLGASYSENKGTTSDNQEGSAISYAYRMQPIIPVYDEIGNFAGTSVPSTGNGQNPVAVLTRNKDDYSHKFRATGSFYAQVNFLKDFYAKSLVGVDYLSNNTNDITRVNPEAAEPTTSTTLSVYNYNTLQYNWTNTLNFSKTFNENHKIDAVAGTEMVANRYRYVGAYRAVFFSEDVDYMYINAGESGIANYGSGSDWRTVSFFGRVNYDYSGKYLLEGTFRRDGSSRFGANNRWGNFPAFSAGWRISEESFMEGTRTWLDNMKIRLGWGMSGNDEIGNYNGFTTFRTSIGYSYYDLGGSNTSPIAGYDSDTYGNADAKWESTTTSNIGIDMTMFNGKISLGIDAWLRNTSDMLYQKAIPSVVGDATAAYINIGEMKNKGLDVSATYNGKAMGGKLSYSVTANISTYKNEVVKLTDNKDEYLAGSELRQMSYTRSYVGWEYPSFYGYIVDGIFQTQAEADAWPTAIGEDGNYNKPGHFKFRDVDGNGYIDSNDRTKIGSPHPDFYGGINFQLNYGNFDMAAFFTGSYGNDMVNYVNRWINYKNFLGNRSKDRLYKSWGSPYLKDNSKATLAMAENDDEISQYPSTHFIEDASYLRLKTFQLGYNLPKKSLDKLKLSNVRIYFQASNLFTLTKYSGLDPEGGLDPDGSDSLMGVDRGAWPTAQEFMLGVDFSL